MQPLWYEIENVATLDSPSLLIYKERVQRNIRRMIEIAGGQERLMTHVKTNKMPEVVKLMLAAGITKFKCATVAEAEMTSMAGANFLIVAHQLVGPKIERLVQLRQQYPDVFMASLVDCWASAEAHQAVFAEHGLVADVLIDVNNGMERSGHPVNKALFELYQAVNTLPNVKLHGFHVYDGHIRDTDFDVRKQKIDDGFGSVTDLVNHLAEAGQAVPMVIAGGTPAFTTHALRTEAYCSPGTCVLWDWGYGDVLTEQPFEYAALILTRVISKPAPGLVTIDMGHKAIAAENPIQKRIRFLNLTNYELLSQSEEHGVLRVEDWDALQVGDVLYGVPYHVCPTVNLYDEAYVVQNQVVNQTWQVLGRKRKITV
ncbi:MAG: D-TA family PLP-dependent enzyme [Spirosomataceae bacterium]